MILRILVAIYFVVSINAYPLFRNSTNLVVENNEIKLYVMVSAKTQSLEIYVQNARLIKGDTIVVKNSDLTEFQKNSKTLKNIENDIILGKYEPQEKHDWIKTDLKFNYKESKKINSNTKCYSHWVNYIDKNGNILSSGCIKAHPKWMNNMKNDIKNFNMKEIFIPGSHDSGSYRPNFNPKTDETIITKYALTQDDDIKSQLMHGIRYLDIRMGYYGLSKEKFYMVHGITKQRPLREALEQLKQFVIETNEIVIFDIRKFETGFQDIEIHQKLVKYITNIIGEHLVDATLTWDVKIDKIWESGKNIILTYGQHDIRNEYNTILFDIVNHRWGNKDDWPSLKEYLKRLHARYVAKADSDMAELTPNAWGIITDKYGGLRKLADDVNQKVSELYLNELGLTTNILSVDFYRGTIVTDLAIYFNKLRKFHLDNIQ